MTSDSIRPPEKRYNYSNAISGLVQLVRHEGVGGLFRGLETNTVCPHAAEADLPNAHMGSYRFGRY